MTMNEVPNFIETDTGAIYDQVIGALEQSIGEDLYPGDERRIFGEVLVAFVVALYSKVNDACKQRLLQYARGEVLDALGARTNTVRLQPAKAKTTLRFSVAQAQEQDIVIPAGTKAANGDGLTFATDFAVTLAAGLTYIDSVASAEFGGSEYNGLTTGSIAILVNLIPGIASVANTAITVGGDSGEPYDDEGDESYRDRIRKSPSRFSTAGPKGAYEFHALSADPDIISVAVVSPEPCEIVLVPLMKDGQIPDEEVLGKVLAACNDERVRPLTDQVSVAAPQTEVFDISLKYYVTADIEAEVVAAAEGSNGAIENYVKWQTQAMGRAINPDQLRKLILDAGALRLDLTSPEFTEITDLKVAQLGNMTISHEVVDE